MVASTTTALYINTTSNQLTSTVSNIQSSHKSTSIAREQSVTSKVSTQCLGKLVDSQTLEGKYIPTAYTLT